MAKDRSNSSSDYTGPLRRLLLVVLTLALGAIFLLWRIDSPRVERFRAQITDRLVPNLDWASRLPGRLRQLNLPRLSLPLIRTWG